MNLKQKADKALRTAEYAEQNNKQKLLKLQRKRLQEIDEKLPEGQTAGDIA